MHSPGPGSQTLHRIARAAMRNPAAMPYAALLDEVQDAVDVIVFLVREVQGRRVVGSIDEVGRDAVQTVFHRTPAGLVRDGAWHDLG